jgi:phage tail tape-measure protein
MDIFKNNLAVGITAAIAATILAPVLVPIITVAGRPLAKSLVKGGVILYEKGRETVAGVGEVMEDMIAEVRSEMEQRPGTATGAAAGAAAGATAAAAQQAAAGQRGETGTVGEPGEERVAPPEAGVVSRPTGDGARM